MSQLILTGVIRGSASTMCSFTVSVDDGPFASPDNVILDKAFFTIPDLPAKVAVRATAVDAAKYGTVDGLFRVDPAGNLLPDNAPPEFEPPQTIVALPFRTIALFVHFTPLVNVTSRALASLSPIGPGGFPDGPPAPKPANMSFRKPFVTPMPPPSLQPRERPDVTFIDTPSIDGSALRVVSRTSTPRGDIIVFEWRGVTAPRLFAVFWPTAVEVGPIAAGTPFLLYFHPTAGQNAPAFFTDARDRRDSATGSTYPWGFDYLFFGFWRYLNYEGDSLREDPFCKGLPHQIEASGRNVVLVLPLNKVSATTCDETASLKDASFVQELLEELQAYVFRRAGNYQPPGIGHLAMASFSSGHALLSCFLRNPSNHLHPLYLDVLREVYLFDPHADLVSETLGPVQDVALWAQRGQTTTKVARLYTQNDATQLAPVLAKLGVPAGSGLFDATALGNPRRSAACLPLAAWNALGKRVNSAFSYQNTGAVHQVISALMLTDALRRSDFPRVPLRIHLRDLEAPPAIPIDQMMANARALYSSHGIEIVEASRETVATLGGGDIERFLILFVGEARVAEPTTDVTELHEALRARGGDDLGADLGPFDVVIAFVGNLVPACRGCASHPPEKPGVVLSARAATEWTLAHELGHLLGLEHVVDPDHLMFVSTTSIADASPTLTDDDVATIVASPLIQG